MPPKYEKICPYCGKTCKAYYPNNIFCECGAKYYLKTDTWLERKKEKENPDLVEVVRCKDCKYYKVRETAGYGVRSVKSCCRSANKKVNEEDYCSYGERREE